MYDSSYTVYDDYCPHCGKGYFFEVGFQITCENCNMPFAETSEIPEFHPDDDVLLDDRYVSFDHIKAFRIIRELGRLDEC